MNKKIILIILAILFSFSIAQAQEKATDHELICGTIDMYFEGWLTGDTTKLGKAMHQTCQLKNIKNGEVLVIPRPTYLGFFKPRPRRENSEGRIVSINVTEGKIGSAKVELETPKRLFTDYFNLMKIKGHWVIVDKISTSVAKE